MNIQPSWPARLLGVADYRSAEIRPEGIRVTGERPIAMISFASIRAVRQTDGLFWSQILLVLDSGHTLALTGVPRSSATLYKALIEHRRASFVAAAKALHDHSDSALSLADWLQQGWAGQLWVAHSQLADATSRAQRFTTILTIPPHHLTDDTRLVEATTQILRFIANPDRFRNEANELFIATEPPRWKHYFDTIEANPLTDRQRLAVIIHEDNTRVIAAAGSGKTSVIVAKAGYLLKSGLCQPERLLLLAYNRNAANALSMRLADPRHRFPVQATTFHALGLSILGEVEGEKPTLSKLAEDDQALNHAIQEHITALLKTPGVRSAVRTYFQSFFAPDQDPFEFQNLLDYYAYLNSVDLRTIQGERVRSYAEAEIANFLFLNGVRYRYEERYKFPVADATHRQYQPDFYLTDHDLYIEHFGIDRDGSTAPHIPREKYHADMEWKRRTHRRYGTRLIETFHYMKHERTLPQDLKALLRDAGVTMHRVSDDAVIAALKKHHRLDAFSKLVAAFLGHYKSGGYTFPALTKTAKARGLLDARFRAFTKVFEPMLARYEAHLAATRTIDFHDMIARATDHVESGRYRSPYTCILIDEFQDISAGRARLAQALSRQISGTRLFCVGDDWQSIYRFAGSDIAFLSDSEQHFGKAETAFLDHTFRCNDRVAAVATRFILANPAQIQKTVSTSRSEPTPRVIIHLHAGAGTAPTALDHAFDEIQNHAGFSKATVLVLGRYANLAKTLDSCSPRDPFSTLDISFSTVHKAKGSEADYVVVLGMHSGRPYGFPSEIADDPLLGAVLSAPEAFPHAKERRLLYVALTRARHAVHLIADSDDPSPFTDELRSYTDMVQVREQVGLAASTAASKRCPVCRDGVMVERIGAYGRFLCCSNFEQRTCSHTADAE